ncbi:MAG: insulinase family protein [Calditrichaeota bacterium]|nr:insulinase family protein [Calditrichota bacterium]
MPALFLILLLAASSYAAPSRVGRLSNGMDYVLVPNHSVPMIAANIVINAGARDETWHTWGAAHFLEHLLFNGTIEHSQAEIYAAFDRIGAYHNAHTGSHFTNFMLLVEGSKFGEGFPILAEMVFASTLPPHKFNKERGIVMEEIAKGKAAGEDPDRLFREALFGGSPLSREVLGTEESIARLERDSVLAFYHRWYQPNNCLLFVTGDFGPDTLIGWLDRTLTAYPPAELPHRRQLAAPDFEALAGLGALERAGSDDRRHLQIAFPAPSPRSSDFPATLALSGILDSRLKAVLPAGVRGGSDIILDPDISIFQISISSSRETESEEAIRNIVDLQVNKIIERGVEPQEIARFAGQYRSDLYFNSERLHYFGIMYARYWAAAGWDAFASWEERLGALKPSDVQRVAKEFLGGRGLAMAIEPADTATTERLSQAASLTRSQSSGGITTIVRSDPSARVFALHILFKGRSDIDARFGAGAVDLLHRCLEEAASGGTALANRKDDLAISLKCADDPSIPYDDYYTSPDYSFIRLEMLPDKWDEGIRFAADLLTTSVAEKALAAAKDRARAGRTASGRSPAAAGSMHLRKLLLGEDHPLCRSVYGDVEGFDVALIEKVRFALIAPESMIASASGPADEMKITQGLQSRLTNLRRLQPLPPKGNDDLKPMPLVVRFDSISAGQLRDTLHLGRAQGAVVMGKVIRGIDPADRAALVLANAWLSDRMGTVLREQRGLAYSLGSSLSLHASLMASDRSSVSLGAVWEITLATRPENLDRAEAGIRELLDEFDVHAFKDEEVERLVAAISGRALMRDMSRIGQAWSMATGDYYWGDPEARTHLIEALKKVDSEGVGAVVRRYLTGDGLTTVMVK